MRTTRLISVAALVTGGLLLTTASAHAVVNPVATLNCLMGGASTAGGMVSPATLVGAATAVNPATLIPTELPFLGCV